MAFVKVGPAFFEERNGQLTAVSDPKTLQGLLSGSISYKTQSTISGGADRFSSPTKTTSTQTTQQPRQTTQSTSFDSDLFDSPEFKNLSAGEQDAVRSVFQAIAENDTEMAGRLQGAFEAAAKIADPFFKQQLLLARDTLERGFTAIDQEQEFVERQLKTRLADLRADIENRKEFLGLEEQSQLRSIERQYDQALKATRQNLAASGFTSSSRREETETLLNETTGDLRETTTRRFGAQAEELTTQLNRSERDTESEIERLTQVATGKKVDIFRQGEATLGTANLPKLNTDIDPLGNIAGEIPQAKQRDIISGVQNLIF